MSERENLNEGLRLAEGLYAAAKALRDHAAAKAAAEEIARQQNLLMLCQEQEAEEAK